MANIIDYIKWRGDISFQVSPFNPVDNLLLSELSYMAFNGLIDRHGDMPIDLLCEKYFEATDKTTLGLLLTGEFDTMFKSMAASSRFSNINVRESVSVYDKSLEVQFAVTLFELDRNTCYIGFRGTDDTIIGWKEDFNMSFMDEIPAQRLALDYLNKVDEKYKYRNIYIGGHSKGGNLAVYSAVHAKTLIKDKILKVYNNDGPGFKQGLIKTKAYKSISDRIITLIPQSSVVGLLLEHEESYYVVKSNQKGLMQHDGFSWQVEGKDFIYLSGIQDDSIAIDMTIKQLLNELSMEQRASYTNTLFELIAVGEEETLAELGKGGLKTFLAMSKNYANLDKETKKVISKTMTYFIDRSFRNYLEVKNVDQWREKIRTHRQNLFSRQIQKDSD